MERENGVFQGNRQSVTTRVVDSYRMVDKNYFGSLQIFFEKVCHISAIEADYKVEFLSFYEEEYAVKWFDVLAYLEKDLVGYVRVLRHPEKKEEWLFTDLLIDQDTEKEEIIKTLYDTALKLVMEYDLTEKVSVSLRNGEKKLIDFHEKMGFVDTHKQLEFANLRVEQDSSEFVLPVYSAYPLCHSYIHEEMLLPLWEEYYRQKGRMDEDVIEDMLQHLDKKEENPNVIFEIKWCGNKKMGFFYKDDFEEIDMNVVSENPPNSGGFRNSTEKSS